MMTSDDSVRRPGRAGEGPRDAEARAGGPILSASHVTVDYRPRRRVLFRRGEATAPALDDVSLDVLEGEALAVIGESGSGKTTLTRTLLGLRSPTSGTLLYEGSSVRPGTPAATSLRHDCGIVFQNPFSSLDPRWRIARSVAEPLVLAHPDWEERDVRRRVSEALEAVGMPYGTYGSRYPCDLSGGQNQRAAIARAIITSPRILLADEPMSAIDVPTRVQILDLLRRLQGDRRESGRPMSIVIVSHDLGMVQHIADRLVVLRCGRVVESGTTDEVLEDPRSDYTRDLLRAASW